jgi:hypothetical protein
MVDDVPVRAAAASLPYAEARKRDRAVIYCARPCMRQSWSSHVGRRCALLLLSVHALLLCAGSVRADGALAGNGQPITTSAYAIDLTRGPVLSSSRATGLAGAFTAIAEGAEGGLTNPAAVSNRYAASADWWDYWLAFGFTYPIANGDFFNSGKYLHNASEIPESSFWFLNPGLYVQLWGLGVGLDMDVQQLTAKGTTQGKTEQTTVHLTLITNHVQVGYLFFDGQLSLGGGLTILRELVSTDTNNTDRQSVFNGIGFGGEVGALIRPNGQQWRIGLGFYSSVVTHASGTEDASGDVVVDSIYYPHTAVRPWQGNLAFAYQFGKRPLNPRFIYVEQQARIPLAELDAREREARRTHEHRLQQLRAARAADMLTRLGDEEREYAEQQKKFEAERSDIRKTAWREIRARVRTEWARFYVLALAELTLTGQVADAVGVESFLVQTVQRSGEKVTATPRLAVESEVWPNQIKVRTGSYLEPTRFEQSSPRLHWTVGVDIKVLHWGVFGVWPEDYLWQISTALDVARDYSAFSVSLNGWY